MKIAVQDYSGVGWPAQRRLSGRLYDHLVNHFGEDSVFMDIDSIERGVDFLQVIPNAVTSCNVLIAVIGKQWLLATDERSQTTCR